MVEMVNGYVCHNCTDVDYAKRHVDPQHPKDGPFGIDKPDAKGGHGPAVVLAGSLAKTDATSATGGLNGVSTVPGAPATDAVPGSGSGPHGAGQLLDVTA